MMRKNQQLYIQLSKTHDTHHASIRTLKIPVVGIANCGPANVFAEEHFHGFLHVSTRLVERAQSLGLFAIKAEGHSMNNAVVKGKNIEDGDYVIIDSLDTEAKDNDIVLVIIDGKATVKRFTCDNEHNQIILRADSSFEYEPIYLHSEDDCRINGKVISIIKKPQIHV